VGLLMAVLLTQYRPATRPTSFRPERYSPPPTARGRSTFHRSRVTNRARTPEN